MQPRPLALQLAWELAPLEPEPELKQVRAQEQEQVMGPEPHPTVMVVQQHATPGVARMPVVLLLVLAPKQETEAVMEQKLTLEQLWEREAVVLLAYSAPSSALPSTQVSMQVSVPVQEWARVSGMLVRPTEIR